MEQLEFYLHQDNMKKGFTLKKTCTIGTNFSAVSITFTFIIIAQVGLQHMFIPFYLTVTLASIIAAIILPKIGPLKNKSQKTFNNQEKNTTDEFQKVTLLFLMV